MARVFLGLGANMGDRLGFLQRAVGELRRTKGVAITGISSVYETDPVGFKNQRDFLNLALEADVLLEADELLQTVKEIEKRVGRTQFERWGPREVDIDILFYDDKVIETESLRIPHPELARRRFVLVPLQELDAQFVHPVHRATVRDLLETCANGSGVRKSTLTVSL